MTCKGVYASLGFSIYITKDELNTLMTKGMVIGSAYIGKQLIGSREVKVLVNGLTARALRRVYAEDKQALDQAKSSMASGYIGRKRTKH